MDLKTFIDTAWAEHGDNPEAVAERLPQALPMVETVLEVRQVAALVVHVFGEHLAQWPEGIALLNELGKRPAAASDEAQRALQRSHAVLALGEKPGTDLKRLPLEDQVAALATASSLHLTRGGLDDAIDLFRLAVGNLPGEFAADSPTPRALAIAGNNLACELEELEDRDAACTEAMLLAARTALTWWAVAGGWTEVEQAEYRMARSLLQAGQAAAALEHALACQRICRENQAPPFEQFFASAVCAMAERANGNTTGFLAARTEARDWHGKVEAGERRWCDNDLKELED
jgi:hypothetical protein